MTEDNPLTQEDINKIRMALQEFAKDVSETWNEQVVRAARHLFKCWKCGKEIDPKETIIVDRTSGFIHEKCQEEYKGE